MLYIAYGANINPVHMRQRCPDAEYVDSGILRGYTLSFRRRHGRCFVTIEESESDTDGVPAVLWRITEADEHALDLHMGFPTICRKEWADVQCIRRKRAGFLYALNGGESVFPPGDLFDCIQRGYDYAGFDILPLHKALRSVNPAKYDQAEKMVREQMRINRFQT